VNSALARSCGILALAIFTASAPCQPNNDNASAVAAARTRQERVQSVDVTITRTEVVAKGTISKTMVGPIKAAGAVPASDTTLRSQGRLVVDGNRVRVENNHPYWHVNGTLYQKQTISVTNGSLAKKFFPLGISSEDNPKGILEKTARQEDGKRPSLMPLTMTFRGLDLAVAPWSFAQMKPSGVVLRIEKADCQEYTISLGALVYSFWLDPNQDYVIRRVRNLSKGHVTEQVDIHYKTNAVCGWAPDSWTTTEYANDGRLLSTSKVDVVDLHLNEAPRPEEFDFAFPEGTDVYDQKNDKEYKVQSDGSMRELSRSGEEIGSTIDQPGYPWYRRNQWLLLALGILVIGSTAVVLYRRRASKIG
jgi:hypothetical protein